MLASGYDVAVAQMNSQQMWLSTKDYHKIKPVKNSNVEEEGTTEAPPQA